MSGFPKKDVIKEYVDKIAKYTGKRVDVEVSHCEVDKILCELLILLGYEEVVTEYDKVKKWYG